MRALVLREYGKLELQDMPEPAIGPGDALVKVKACGICGSDVHGMEWSTGRRILPIIMGHEASGVIANVGADVSGWAPGDRVAFDSMLHCAKCQFLPPEAGESLRQQARGWSLLLPVPQGRCLS